MDNGNLPRLLLVDDCREVCASLARLFKIRCQVEIAYGVRDALFAISFGKFDAIWTDQDMRDGCGLQVLEAAMRCQPHAKRILCSARTPTSLDALLANGLVNEWVEKPAVADVALRIVSTL